MWIELSLKGKFAFSAKPLSVYRLNAFNRSGQIHKEAIIPCQLKWFYKNIEIIKKHKLYKSIKKFIYSNIFIITYGLALDKNYISIKAIIDYMKKNKDYFYIFLLPSFIIPVRILDFIKKTRRKLR